MRWFGQSRRGVAGGGSSFRKDVPTSPPFHCSSPAAQWNKVSTASYPGLIQSLNQKKALSFCKVGEELREAYAPRGTREIAS